MKKIGVVVARFQVNYLHDAHKDLLRYVADRNDAMIIVIGDSSTRLTDRNPLPLESRKQMVFNFFLHSQLDTSAIRICKLQDRKNDLVWSQSLDKLIDTEVLNLYSDHPDEGNPSETNICLYGARDSFLKYYDGGYRTETAPLDVPHLSGNRIRKGLHSFIKDSIDWREGVIWASAHKYPASFQTVDIAPINEHGEVLLGRKPGETLFRFIGGFVDPTDTSLEYAAKRECHEEVKNIETDLYQYIGSFRIDDWRYRSEPDKIMTAFYACKFIYGNPTASDDIEECRFFKIEDLLQRDIEPEHHPLLVRLLYRHFALTK